MRLLVDLSFALLLLLLLSTLQEIIMRGRGRGWWTLVLYHFEVTRLVKWKTECICTSVRDFSLSLSLEGSHTLYWLCVSQLERRYDSHFFSTISQPKWFHDTRRQTRTISTCFSTTKKKRPILIPLYFPTWCLWREMVRQILPDAFCCFERVLSFVEAMKMHTGISD